MVHAASRELEHVLFTYYCQTGAHFFPNLTQQPEAKTVFFQMPAKLSPFQVMGCRMTFGLLFQSGELEKLTIFPFRSRCLGKDESAAIIKYL